MSIESIAELIAVLAGLLSLAGFARDVRKQWATITIRFIKPASKILLTFGGDLLFLIIWVVMIRFLHYMVLTLFPFDSPSFLLNALLRILEVSTFAVVLMFIVTDVAWLISYFRTRDSHVEDASK